MKKLINIAFIYSIFAMIGGVFFREFTKLNGYTGVTSLGKIHTHLFTLGMFMFLILAIFAIKTNLLDNKKFKTFLIVYNIGVIGSSILLLTRGIIEVLNIDISSAVNASISGISGLAHILTGVGIILLFTILRKTEIKQ